MIADSQVARRQHHNADTCHVHAALAHQADFDVCWCKGSVAEKIFSPLVEQIKGNGGNIVGGRLVTDVVTDAAGRVTGIKTKQRGGQEQQLDADAVIFAVGINGALQ